MINTRYYITCTRCNRYAQELESDTEEGALQEARNMGWDRRKVKNGSLWDFCPRCLMLERNPGTSVSSPCTTHTDPNDTGCCSICGEQLIS